MSDDNDNEILAQVAKERAIDKIYTTKAGKLSVGQHLKRATIAQHFKRILHIQTLMTGRKNVNDLSFLKKTQKVIKFIEDRYSKNNSRQAQLLSIGSVLKEMAGYEAAYAIYHAYTARLALKITRELLLQQQTPEEYYTFNKISDIIYNNNLSGIRYGPT
jgi:hypothetical protein